jgi:hypothetical protein
MMLGIASGMRLAVDTLAPQCTTFDGNADIVTHGMVHGTENITSLGHIYSDGSITAGTSISDGTSITSYTSRGT